MVLYEVERKFVFCRSLLSKFHSNQGLPPFRLLAHRGSSVYRDTYFDSDGVLSKQGLWVRKRNSRWEAKINVGSKQTNYTQAAYEELDSIPKIHELVRSRLPRCPGAEHNFGLGVLCDFTTHRETYIADQKFTVVLDTMDFGHTVGEVELMAEDIPEADRDIDSFIARYAWFFQGDSPPKGKMTAYFERFGLKS